MRGCYNDRTSRFDQVEIRDLAFGFCERIGFSGGGLDSGCSCVDFFSLLCILHAGDGKADFRIWFVDCGEIMQAEVFVAEVSVLCVGRRCLQVVQCSTERQIANPDAGRSPMERKEKSGPQKDSLIHSPRCPSSKPDLNIHLYITEK